MSTEKIEVNNDFIIGYNDSGLIFAELEEDFLKGEEILVKYTFQISVDPKDVKSILEKFDRMKNEEREVKIYNTTLDFSRVDNISEIILQIKKILYLWVENMLSKFERAKKDLGGIYDLQTKN